MSTKIVVTGCKGRMGQCILQRARQDQEVEIVGFVDVGDDITPFLKRGTVIIDFSAHHATANFAKLAVHHECSMVIGTTGFSYEEKECIKHASKSIPIVMSPNMSVGVNLLFTLTEVASSILKDGFDVEIVEKHHRLKKDSPSGTAARLAEIVAEERGVSLAKAAKHGRLGDVGARTKDEIGIHAVRGGSYVGEHTVIFAGDDEIVEVIHRAGRRDIFANGAILAAKWLTSVKPGLYDMPDVLGLKISHQA